MNSKMEGPNKGKQEEASIFNELQTVDFLLKKGVKRLEDFRPRQPIFYVLEDEFRGDVGPFGHLPSNKRPTLAIVASPAFLDLQKPIVSPRGNMDEDKLVYYLHNEGGDVHFFIINSVTSELEYQYTENKRKSYHATKNRLFEPVPELLEIAKQKVAQAR